MQPNRTTLPTRRFITSYTDAQKLEKFRMRMDNRLATAIARGQTKQKRGPINA